MPLLGLIVGLVLGAFFGFGPAIIGAAVGLGVGLLVRRRPGVSEAPPPSPAYGEAPAPAASRDALAAPLPAAPFAATSGIEQAREVPASGTDKPPVVARLDRIDERLERIERTLATLAGRNAAPESIAEVEAAAARSPVAETAPLPDEALPPFAPADSGAPRVIPTSQPAIPPPAPLQPVADRSPAVEMSARAAAEARPDMMLVRGVDGTLQPMAAGRGGGAPLEARAGAVHADAGVRTASLAQAPTGTPPPLAPSTGAPNPLWAWFTGGNAMTRIGIIVLFFGIAFLLRYFTEHFSVPIELRLLGVAAFGAAMVALGLRLARGRPAYGLSLQGAGAGILYLTTFAAFRLYPVLPAEAALVLLIGITGGIVALAVRADSQPLAALAIAGGFLAPILVSRGGAAPLPLLTYFAILNAAIFALAWRYAWRALNVLGFVFTFVLGLVWGRQYYRPEQFAVVEPFLIIFFVFYVGIAILYARRGSLEAKAPVDAMLVFGVPLVGFALQAAMLRDSRYGAAWSALALAVIYGGLFLALRRRPEAGFALLSRAFGVLAVIFATIAIPFAFDARWTSAWWALEAAGVYWIGCRQRQWLPRVFALLLQLGAAIAFLFGGWPAASDRLFLNATFLGTMLIALAALATAYFGERDREALSEREQALSPGVFAWGALWWLGGGAFELWRLSTRVDAPNFILAWIVASVAVALLLRRWLDWRRLGTLGATLLPAMLVVGLRDFDLLRTTLEHGGWLVWPVAWLVHWRVLRAAEAPRDTPDASQSSRWLKDAHTASTIALVVWASWEASEWVGRWTDDGTAWIACAAALPAVVYLAAVVRWRDDPRWPLATQRDAYTTSAGTTMAALLGVWFAIVNVVSPGDPAPLPYVPLANPLDLTLAAALAALFAWTRLFGRMPERTLYTLLGVAAFIALNGVVLRTGHHWGDIPWRLADLLRSKPLQAALTLTWTATALPLMFWATRRSIRPLWMVGAALLAVVVAKLFLLDLGALSGLPRVVAFIGVGLLLLVIGYVAPLPPARPERSEGHG